jgi:hypothetical protein
MKHHKKNLKKVNVATTKHKTKIGIYTYKLENKKMKI